MGRLGTLHGLVNNAGYGLTGAIEDVDDDEARQVLETMVLAPMRLARLVLPAMREAGSGRIVNISSIMGRTATPLTGWYQGSKHALEALSDALRMEVAKDGIQVVLIEPGGFKTNIWEDLERDLANREGSRYEVRLPAHRWADLDVGAAHGRAGLVRQGHRTGPRDVDRRVPATWWAPTRS